jgi:hypothetical protein
MDDDIDYNIDGDIDNDIDDDINDVKYVNDVYKRLCR